MVHGYSGRSVLAELRRQGVSIRTERFWTLWRVHYQRIAWHDTPRTRKPPPLRGKRGPQGVCKPRPRQQADHMDAEARALLEPLRGEE